MFGATLTLPQSQGSLLIAFVAFFVSLVGARFWRIACLLLHVFAYSSRTKRDALHQQHQAVLPNAANAGA